MRINAGDSLSIGQEVRVGTLKGKVVNAQPVRDQFGLPMVVHTIQFTERLGTARGWDGKRGFKTLEKPITKQVNYSFIEIL